jgi:hypothetical protein
MIGRVSVVLAFLALLLVGGADGSASWERVSVTRHAGTVGATLSYDRRRTEVGHLRATDYRRVRLVVRRAGKVVIDSPLRAPIQGVRTTLELTLRDVWGNAGPEAVVRASSCGNRCGEQLVVGLIGSGGHGRILLRDFGGGLPGRDTAWVGQRRDGIFYFVSRDQRFFCVFTDCASSTTPIQVFAIDRSGDRFVDVSRTRPDLITADATDLLDQYGREIRFKEYRTKNRAGYDPMGVLGPWCADQYLLARASVCSQTVARAAADGYLTNWTRGAINSFYKKLTAWGYGR